MITVHGMSMSGNCHKVRLALEQPGRPCRWVEVDAARGGARSPEFLALAPGGKVPLLQLDDGRLLPESNAILCWLAGGAPLLPADPWQGAQALRWLFFGQYSHEPYIAVARFIRGWTPPGPPRRAGLPRLHERGRQALDLMERHLQDTDWFTGRAGGVAAIVPVRLHPLRGRRRLRPVRMAAHRRLAGARARHARLRADARQRSRSGGPLRPEPVNPGTNA